MLNVLEGDEELEKIRRKKLREMFKTNLKQDDELMVRGAFTSDKPIEVTDVTFIKTIQSYPIVVVDCWATWCGPCYMIAPIIEELARDYAGKILFGKLNVDENRRTALQYQIMSIPTMLVFKNGTLIDKLIGALPKDQLKAKLETY